MGILKRLVDLLAPLGALLAFAALFLSRSRWAAHLPGGDGSAPFAPQSSFR